MVGSEEPSMSSIVEKYEQILAADPRSRIFVELAKALVDRGEHARAVEVCRRGLEHHPSSILGRVIWGRALLEAGLVGAVGTPGEDPLQLGFGIDGPNGSTLTQGASCSCMATKHRTMRVR